MSPQDPYLVLYDLAAKDREEIKVSILFSQLVLLLLVEREINISAAGCSLRQG